MKSGLPPLVREFALKGCAAKFAAQRALKVAVLIVGRFF
jgi:hypothetical protein